MNIEHSKKKYKNISRQPYKVQKKVDMEIQQAEASESFGEYHLIPRGAEKRCHKLSGNLKDCYGIGITHVLRMVMEPLEENDMNSKSVKIHEYAFNYH